jgi:hypothetical protein
MASLHFAVKNSSRVVAHPGAMADVEAMFGSLLMLR